MATIATTFTALDEFSFHRRVAATRGNALVIFTSRGCSSCRAWTQLLAAHQATHHDVALFEVDAGTAPALTSEFGVFHLPALFLYRDGQFHCALESEARPEKFRDALRSALAGPPQDEP